MDEKLDFCRVKKIDEKGFGFLKSFYFTKDIFFHFNQIKREEFREKLNAMKRGEFFVYYISKEVGDNKRKVKQFWYSLKDVPKEYLDDFKNQVITEFDSGITNIFDLLFTFSEMKGLNLIEDKELEKIFSSTKIQKLPSVILPFLNKEEIELLQAQINFENIAASEQKPFWFDDFLKFI